MTKKIKRRKKEKTKERTKDQDDNMSDIMHEQLENPMITAHCPESIKENELGGVKKHPENYIEINMINKNRMVDNFYLSFGKKSFRYRGTKYFVDEKRIFLLPSKSGLLTLTCFYKEGSPKAKDFKQMNKGITSKALSILYKEELYQELLVSESKLYNFFIAIFSIILLIVQCIAYYLLFRGGTL